MTLDDLFTSAPSVLGELTDESFRLAEKHIDSRSQHAACYLVILRAISILRASLTLLGAETFDSWDILNRAFMECRELLATFRFDDEPTRILLKRWFNGDKDAWKPAFKKCETFFESKGGRDLQLSTRWGIFSKLSHPTNFACRNSAAILTGWRWDHRREDLATTLGHKKADYVSAIATLIAVVYFEPPEWIPLGFDRLRTPQADALRTSAPSIVKSVLAGVPGSVRV
jgi:hypothetical protein